MGADQNLLCLGVIGAAHGIKGEVRVKSFTSDPLELGSYGPLSTDGKPAVLEVETIRPSKGVVVVRFKGIRDRNAAEALNRLQLFVDRSALPEAEDDDEFYHADLIGLSAVSVDGQALGTVSGLFDFGAGDLVEITSGSGKTTLLPFTMAVVPAISLDEGVVTIDLPDEIIAQPGADDRETGA
ncbi:ribosome maturation factor RimM [Coralliovum pocilloporae]|uniref:ribosome maturation factor RimM n=1 Tax=Coralliovum pocilloporae TaxID=3066369 RepID=UPI0033076029